MLAPCVDRLAIAVAGGDAIGLSRFADDFGDQENAQRDDDQRRGETDHVLAVFLPLAFVLVIRPAAVRDSS